MYAPLLHVHAIQTLERLSDEELDALEVLRIDMLVFGNGRSHRISSPTAARLSGGAMFALRLVRKGCILSGIDHHAFYHSSNRGSRAREGRRSPERRRATIGGIRLGWGISSSAFEPAKMRSPATSNRSLIDAGNPASGEAT